MVYCLASDDTRHLFTSIQKTANPASFANLTMTTKHQRRGNYCVVNRGAWSKLLSCVRFLHKSTVRSVLLLVSLPLFAEDAQWENTSPFGGRMVRCRLSDGMLPPMLPLLLRCLSAASAPLCVSPDDVNLSASRPQRQQARAGHLQVRNGFKGNIHPKMKKWRSLCVSIFYSLLDWRHMHNAAKEKSWKWRRCWSQGFRNTSLTTSNPRIRELQLPHHCSKKSNFIINSTSTFRAVHTIADTEVMTLIH